MPEYLFTGTNAQGRSVTERVTAASTDGARYALETRGYKDIVFHTDDSTREVDRKLNQEMDPDPLEDNPLTPEQELEVRRGGGILSGIWFAWKVHWFMWAPLALWCAFIYRGGQPFTFSDWLGLALTGLFLAYFIAIVLPGVMYQALLRAAVWNRLGETKLWTGLLKRLPLIGGGMIPKLDLDVRLACVLARNGKAEQGRALLLPYFKGEPDPMTLGRLAGFLNAVGEHEQALALQRRAVELSQSGISETIDEALALVRHLRRPEEARAALARLGDREVVEIARIFINYIEGLIALEENKHAEAATLLDKAVQSVAPMKENELMKGMLRDMWAYQALALAGMGKKAEARALFARAKPLLSVRREKELLERCEAALR